MSQDKMSIGAGLTSFTPEVKTTNRQSKEDSLSTVAEQFESLFVYELMKASRSAKLFEDPLISTASDPFFEMMDREISSTVSKQSTLGIAEAIVKQFSAKG